MLLRLRGNLSNKELPGPGEHDHNVEDAQLKGHVNKHALDVLSIEHGSRLRLSTAVRISTALYGKLIGNA